MVDTTAGPRPIAFRPPTAAAELGPSRVRVVSPERPTEFPPRYGRSHSQGRVRLNTTSTDSTTQGSLIFVGIDVAKDNLCERIHRGGVEHRLAAGHVLSCQAVEPSEWAQKVAEITRLGRGGVNVVGVVLMVLSGRTALRFC